MIRLIEALSAIALALFAWWEGRRHGQELGYREGRRDGWNEAVDRLSPPPRFPVPPTITRRRQS